MTKRPRDEPDDGVDEDHRGKLAAADDEVADADFARLKLVDHALVHTLIMTGDEKKPGLCRKLFDDLLIQGLALRREQDSRGLPCIDLFHRHDCVIEGLAHHDHPWSAAKGSIVDLGVLV